MTSKELTKAKKPNYSQPNLETREPEVSKEEDIISLHDLSDIFSLQTLKIWDYVKHHKVVVLIDSGNTHNFINRWKT